MLPCATLRHDLFETSQRQRRLFGFSVVDFGHHHLRDMSRRPEGQDFSRPLVVKDGWCARVAGDVHLSHLTWSAQDWTLSLGFRPAV